jgi:phosphoglycolate phosphatase
VFDAVPQALEQLRQCGLALACVTNKPREFTLPLLERVQLAAHFSAVVAGDDVREKKPHPALLLEACRRLALTPAQVLMVGDSVNDALAARAAGCPVVLVETGYNEGESVHDLGRRDERARADAIVPALIDAARLVMAALTSGSRP